MSKMILFLIIAVVITSHGGYVLGEEYRSLEIKQGIHEDVVNEKYGEPVSSEKVKEGFLPISKKKSLYKIDDSTYMILNFFSGRVNDITVLEDISSDEALSLFRED